MHDLLANHRDTQSSADRAQQQITASGYHCHIDDLVVVAPFLPDIKAGDPVLISSGRLIYAEPVVSFVFSYSSDTDSRGPPAGFYA